MSPLHAYVDERIGSYLKKNRDILFGEGFSPTGDVFVTYRTLGRGFTFGDIYYGRNTERKRILLSPFSENYVYP